MLMIQIVESTRESLEGLRGEPNHGAPWELLLRHTAVVDNLVQGLYDDLAEAQVNSGMALVAVGGYGRRQLTPWSDIDLMFLCEETSSQDLLQTISRILHALWDLHLEVGHSVRTVEDCLDVSGRDLRTWTALMDARLVAGDRALFDLFQTRMRDELFQPAHEAFVKRLVQGVWERHRNYARTPFLVEPNVKEGPGGLRDVQSALWLARCRFPVDYLQDLVDHAFMSQDDATEIRQAHAFLWRVRLELHRQAKRKEDHLTFGMQERLAQTVLLEGEVQGSGVEAFMREYYRHTTRIRYFVEDTIQRVMESEVSQEHGLTKFPEELGDGFLVVRGRLTLLDERAFESNPLRMIEAVAYAHHNQLDLDLFTRDQIKLSLHLVDDSFRKSKRARDAFMSLLGAADCGHKALELMHRMGLVQAYVPEFGRICFQVQHDAYHAYTVDVHSLEAVRELAGIRQDGSSQEGELPQKAAAEVSRWGQLALAAFLHDVGKGEGSGHAQRGAQIVEGILKRWRISMEDRERVTFLVREHLILMDTAMGRDLTEEKVIADLCRTVASVERLNDLYLLTLADLKATGPDLLTDWKDQLLRELYLKARHILETGELASPQANIKIQEARDSVLRGLEGRIEKTELERWVQSLTSRYLLTTPSEDLVDQVLMAWEMVHAGETLRVRPRCREGYAEIVVCTWDAPALFSRICGVLVAHGINILGARIHTWTNRIVMDTFQVEVPGTRGPMEPDRLGPASKDLVAVLEGRLDLQELLRRSAPSRHVKRDRHPATMPQVRIDNRTSDFFTILDIRARDRFGLLFAITRTLAHLDLDIHLALIDTRRGQVVDAFYVQEANGQKVWDKESLALIERELYRAVERMGDDEV
jgi:[protein-PII] uridylyltransferase